MLVGQRDDLLPFPSMVEEGAGYWNADTLTMTRTVLAFSTAIYTPFKFNHTGRFPASQYTVSQINPIYYGLLTAAQMLQSHAAVIPVTLSTSLHIKAHATIDEKHVIRILLINKEETSSGDGNVSLQLPRQGDAEISTLRATNDDYRLSDYTHYTADDPRRSELQGERRRSGWTVTRSPGAQPSIQRTGRMLFPCLMQAPRS